jgi:hypothetical protein
MGKEDPAVSELLKSLPKLERTPKLRNDELFAVGHIVKALPKLRFPIESPRAFADQLGKRDVEVLGVGVPAARAARQMPASAFPVRSLPDLMETIASLLRRNSRLVRLHRELERVGRQVPQLRFPITSRAELLKQVGEGSYSFGGRTIEAKSGVERFPSSFFPITSPLDLKTKAAAVAIRGAR